MFKLRQLAHAGLWATALLFTLDASAATIRINCEVRANRAKISVDGKQLARGSYTTEAVSGGNVAAAGPVRAVQGQVETDYDSDPGDIADGATPIPPDFIVGGSVTGKVVNAAGDTVVSDTVACRVRSR